MPEIGKKKGHAKPGIQKIEAAPANRRNRRSDGRRASLLSKKKGRMRKPEVA